MTQTQTTQAPAVSSPVSTPTSTKNGGNWIGVAIVLAVMAGFAYISFRRVKSGIRRDGFGKYVAGRTFNKML